MRDDFAVFITTHKRPNNQTTLEWLRKNGYTGKYYLVIDDTDQTAPEYFEKYGRDKVLVFDKLKYWRELDTLCNKQHLAAVLYARQYVEDAAAQMGLTAFLVIDDDVTDIVARVMKNGKLERHIITDADRFINAYLDFLLCGNFASICPGTQNLYIAYDKVLQKFPRKGSNAFFRNVQIPIKWKASMNEDIITCIENNKVGIMMCTATPICVETQDGGSGKRKGGMQLTYDAMSSFERAFYAVIVDPSRAYVRWNSLKDGTTELRIARQWAGGDPCIISGTWRKER